MLAHPDHRVLNPDINTPLSIGDQILFCGNYGLARRMAWSLNDPHGFRALVTGEAEPVSSIGRWLKKQRDETHLEQDPDLDLQQSLQQDPGRKGD